MEDSEVGRETTILTLAEKSRAKAVDINTRLYEHFSPPQPTSSEAEGIPTQSVLDQIISILEECTTIQQTTIEYLQIQVFPKIH